MSELRSVIEDSPIDMIAVCVASILAIALPLIHAMLVRMSRRSYWWIFALLGSLLVYATAWCAAMLALRGTQWLAPRGLIAGFCCLGFFGLGYMETYSLISRGFTISLLVQIYTSRSSITVQQLLENYAGGRGMEWMLDKRLEGLEALGLIRREGTDVHLTRLKGKWAAHLGLIVKRLLRLGAGG